MRRIKKGMKKIQEKRRNYSHNNNNNNLEEWSSSVGIQREEDSFICIILP